MRTLLQTALFSFTSSRTSDVFITRFANLRISLTARGACFLTAGRGDEVRSRKLHGHGEGGRRSQQAGAVVQWVMRLTVRVVELLVQVDGVLPGDRVARAAALLVLRHGRRPAREDETGREAAHAFRGVRKPPDGGA